MMKLLVVLFVTKPFSQINVFKKEKITFLGNFYSKYDIWYSSSKKSCFLTIRSLGFISA